MLYITIIAFFIVVYIAINLYIKLDLLEKQIEASSIIEQDTINLVESLLIKYTKVLQQLKRIDRLGSFESDDEVGFVYKTIKETIVDLVSELDELMKNINNDEEAR